MLVKKGDRVRFAVAGRKISLGNLDGEGTITAGVSDTGRTFVLWDYSMVTQQYLDSTTWLEFVTPVEPPADQTPVPASSADRPSPSSATPLPE
jgi:hypothetical protein